MKLCTSFGTRLGVQVRDFSACFGYFTKWNRTTLWYLEITSSLVFNLLDESIENITWPRRDTKFLFECRKTFHEWARLSNCLMMNLKLQNAAQRRFVFVECWAVKLFSCVEWLSRTFLACSKRSDSGERCEVKKAIKSRGGSHRSPLSERLEQARTFSTSLASCSWIIN